jgi:hypothetical protein
MCLFSLCALAALCNKTKGELIIACAGRAFIIADVNNLSLDLISQRAHNTNEALQFRIDNANTYINRVIHSVNIAERRIGRLQNYKKMLKKVVNKIVQSNFQVFCARMWRHQNGHPRIFATLAETSGTLQQRLQHPQLLSHLPAHRQPEQ